MGIDKLHEIKNMLIENAYERFNYIPTHEMYEIIDMIKDIAEVVYYCTIVSAMEASEETPTITVHAGGHTTVE